MAASRDTAATRGGIAVLIGTFFIGSRLAYVNRDSVLNSTHMGETLGKRGLNKARKREEIVAIATRSFLERGYAATSMSAIADELGGSKTTLWSHFSSKEELFVAVVDNRVECFAHEVECALDINHFSTATLRELCLRLIEQLLTSSAARLYALVVSEGGRFPEIKQAFFTRGPARVHTKMHQFFASRFDEPAAAELSRIVLFALFGFRSDALITPSSPTIGEREQFVDSLIARLELDDMGAG